MKTTLLTMALSCTMCWGQAPDDCRPSTLNVPESKYPCVYADNRATFRVVAPNAQKVTVRIGRGFDMAKGPDGIWTVTTTPLVVGFHYYSLQIDGATVADPSTMTYFGSGGRTAPSKFPRPVAPQTTILPRMCRVATSASSGITPRLPASGGAASSIRRRITAPTSKLAIPYCICSTAGARMKPAGTPRVTSTSSWTT